MGFICDSVQDGVLFVDDFVAVFELSWLAGVLKVGCAGILHECISMGIEFLTMNLI